MITDFQKRVYEEVKKIKKGEVKSYGQLAKKLKTSPRAIGQALKKNFNPEIPCHRVIKSNSELGGYNKGIIKKIKLLRSEGVKIKGGKIQT